MVVIRSRIGRRTHPSTSRGAAMDIIYRYDPYKPIVTRQLEDAAAAIEILGEGHGVMYTIVTQVHREITGRPFRGTRW